MASTTIRTILAIAFVAAFVATAIPVTNAAADYRGVVITDTHTPTADDYTVRTDSGTGASGQIFGGRGASFPFFEHKALLPIDNAASGNHGGYWSCGSGCGRKAFLDTAGAPVSVDTTSATNWAGDAAAGTAAGAKWTLWAGSDAPLSVSERATALSRGGEPLHIPITIGVVGLAYNYPAGCGSLHLTPAQISGLYKGTITQWGQLCGNGDTTTIKVFVRCDSSGTTFAFTDFLARSVGAPNWPAPTSGPLVSPTGNCGNTNAGMGSGVATTPNSIGYVELDQIRANNLQMAAVQNRDGNFVVASEAGGQAAVDAAAPTLPRSEDDWSAVSLVWQPGASAYPITSFSYALVWGNPFAASSNGVAFTTLYTADQYNALRSYLSHVVNDDQVTIADGGNLPNGYVPLPDSVKANANRGLARMQYGATVSAHSDSVLDYGYAVPGAVGSVTGGIFTPDSYQDCAGTAVAQQVEGTYCAFGTSLTAVLGKVVVTDDANVGAIGANNNIDSGTYTTGFGQIVNGVWLVTSVA